MHRRKRIATIGIAAVCALVGAAAGIAESSAASKTAKATTKRHATHAGFAGGFGGPGGPGGPGGHGMAVHSVEVVLNKAGTAFITETEDSGTVTAVDASGATLTIKEGTSSVTYGTPTITIPSGATVTLDGKTSSLDKLVSGDHVSIRSSSEGTDVFATDSSFTPPEHGQGGPGGQGGPPPGGQGSWG
jgi:hypothetical protein